MSMIQLTRIHRRTGWVACLLVVAFAIGTLGNSAIAQSEVTITWWMESDPGTRQANRQIIEKFEEAYPNVRVEYEEFPEYSSKIASAFAAGIEPDISIFYGRTIGTYIKNNLLLKLTPDLMTRQQVRERIFGPPVHKDPFVGKDGEYYAVSISMLIHHLGCIVNMDLWNEAGLGAWPDTWQGLMEAARKMTKRGGDGKVTQAGLGHPEWEPYTQLLAITKQFGGEYYNDQTKRWNLTSPEAIEAIKFWKDTYLQVNGPEIPSDYQAFIKRYEGILITGGWVWGHLKYTAPELVGHVSYHVIPPIRGIGYCLAENGPGVAIPASIELKEKEAALNFVGFFIKPENIVLRFRLFQRNPAIKGLWAMEDFKEGGSMHFLAPVMRVIKNQPQRLFWDYSGLPDRNEINDIMKSAWQKILADKLSVEEGAAKMQRDINNIMKKNFPSS